MATNPASDIIDLRATVRKLLARWWWFVITGAVAFACGIAYLKVTPKSYMVQATILMGEGGKPGFGQKEDFLKGMSLVKGSSQLDDDIGIMTSRTNIRKTLQRLDLGWLLYAKSHFSPQQRYEFRRSRVTLDSVAVLVSDIPIHVQVDRGANTGNSTILSGPLAAQS